jgi:hypothetical protein
LERRLPQGPFDLTKREIKIVLRKIQTITLAALKSEEINEENKEG